MRLLKYLTKYTNYTMDNFINYLGQRWAKFHTTPSKTRWGVTADYEKYWYISDHGNVMIRYNYRPDEDFPRIALIGGHPDKQYQAISINNACEKYIHRLVCRFFVENPKPDEYNVVHHIDESKMNNHYTNLVWTTHKENLRLARESRLRKLAAKKESK